MGDKSPRKKEIKKKKAEVAVSKDPTKAPEGKKKKKYE